MPAAANAAIVHYAISYAERGWLIFPCHSIRNGRCSCDKDCGSPGKHPRTVSGVKDATPDTGQIKKWWSTWPDANIGLATGKQSGIFVIDIDTKHDGAVDGLRTLEAENGRLPLSLRAKTGSGGWHFFYRYPESLVIRNKQKLGGVLGIDVRGEGGYVIAPPSNHSSGNCYEWAGEDELAAAPDKWLALLSSEAVAPIESGPKQWTTDPAIIARAVRYLSAVPPAISGQGGHGQTFAAAGAVVHGFGIEPTTALGLLLAHYNPRCVPPWKESELRHKVNDAASKPSIKPFGYLRDSSADFEVNSIDWENGGTLEEPSADDGTPRKTFPPAYSKKPYIANYVNIPSADGDDPCNFAVPIEKIGEGIRAGCEGQPYIIQRQLIALRPYNPQSIPSGDVLRFLNNQQELFAWLHERCELNWPSTVRKGMRSKKTGEAVSLVTREGIWVHLRETDGNYSSIEILPHYPVVDGTFYVPIDLGESQGHALAEFLANVNPETEDDRKLILAALMTPAWGGDPGARPAFVFASDHGRGTGKSKTADLICDVYGGAITIQEGDDWHRVRERLLADDSLGSRCILMDNVKGKLSGQQIESMITAPVIDGHKLYVGQYKRPNRLTYIITSNSPSLSQDLAERSVVIKIGSHRHGKDWEVWRKEFLASKRRALLADIYAAVSGPDACSISEGNRDRWSLWQRSILAKLDDGDRLAALIKARRESVDADQDDAIEVSAAITKALESCYMAGVGAPVRFSSSQMHHALRQANLVDDKFGQRQATSWLRNLIGAKGLKGLRRGRDASGSRCWVYYQDGVNPNQTVVNLPETYGAGASYGHYGQSNGK